MTHIPQEDDDLLISGEVDPFAIEDDTTDAGVADEEQTAETKVIQEIREYLKTAIAEHNSFDVLDLPNNATDEQKIAVFNMLAIHTGVTMHLRNIGTIINNKVREN